MNQNEDFLRLMDALPADVARRSAAGDIPGALRLIDGYLAAGKLPELAPRLRAERVRLERLERNYPYDRAAAIALVQEEWPDFTGERFDALVDARRIDWRYVRGVPHFHSRFLNSLRLYPQEAPGLKRTAEGHTARDEMLRRMEAEGGLSADITLRASICPAAPAKGKRVQAWLPLPAACPQQEATHIEILSATPGGQAAPVTAEARTIYWDSAGTDSFEVVYRYRHTARYVDPLTLPWDGSRPQFYVGEYLPHIAFTPCLRDLAVRLTEELDSPVEKAAAIYGYVTEFVDYRFQPAYVLLDSIADSCAKELRGDCGVMALLFITLCRAAGVPARWQSGLHVTPDAAGCHDWAMFYAAPYGWLYADPSFGSGARRNGEAERRKHYFGNLDPCRMVANSAFQAPLTPPAPCYRSDPYDNQLGEMAVDGVGLDGWEMERSVDVVEFKFL